MLTFLLRCVTLFTFMLAAGYSSVSGQKQNILVVVRDSANNKPLAKATAVIISRKDSALIDFGITDSLGKYLFKNVNSEKAGFIVTSVAGYNDKKIPLAAPLKESNTRVPDITMEVLLSPKFVALENVLVMGKASPIRMNKDTLEFDADFFKSHPTAMLEDLLRKLPGVEIREGNEVYINGQRVSKILIEGKEFFSTDPVIILKNLPAEIIAKVQVANDKKTIAKETRQQKDIPKVINLKLKREVKRGMFGKFFTGGGSDDRYEAGGILNVFRDTLQISFIGSSNNQSRNGFSMQDLNDLGGFGRSGELGSQSARDLTNDDSRGIETKHGAGVNINYNIGKNIQLNGQYFFSGSKRQTGYDYVTQQLLADSALLNNGVWKSNGNQQSHKASVGLKWKQDSTGNLSLQLNTNFTNNNEETVSASTSYSKNAPLLSKSSGSNKERNRENNIAVRADYDKTFEALDIDWTINSSYTNVASNNLTTSDNRYIRIVNNFLPDSVRQFRDNSTPSRELYIHNNFNKNWGEKHTITWKEEYTNRQETIGGDTYQFSKVTKQDELVSGLSVQLMQQKHRMNHQLSYRYSFKGFTIMPGISVRQLFIRNRYNYDSIPVLNRQYTLVSPVLEINYKDIGFSLYRNLEEPYAWSLRPVTDSSSPLYISIGNPNLKPSKSTNLSLNYYKYFDHSKIDLSMWGSINYQTDAIGNSRQVFPDNKTISEYINLPQVNSYHAAFNINKSYAKNNLNYNTGIGINVSVREAPVLLNLKLINTTATFINPAASVSVEYKNKYRWKFRYRMSTNRSTSEDSTVRSANTISHALNNTLHVQFFRRLSWDANINYNLNPGIPSGYQKQWLFCDMALTYSFLQKDRAQLKLSGFDIFNQNQGIQRYAYQNYITDQRSLVQKQYFMLTFLYTVRKF